MNYKNYTPFLNTENTQSKDTYKIIAQATAAVASKKKQNRKNMKIVCARDALQGRNDGLQFCITLNCKWKQKTFLFTNRVLHKCIL